MRIKLEEKDIQAIAVGVAKELKPLLKSSDHSDSIFNQDELAEYLKVSRSWVDQKISQNEIPFFKCGKYPRFKKSDIDKWTGKKTLQSAPLFSIVHKRKK